jgi:hypothetical protein
MPFLIKIDMKSGVFWFVVNVFLGLVFVFFVLFMLTAFKVLENNSNYYLAQIVQEISIILLPVIGHMLFMPTIAVLTSVFI